MLLDFEVNLAKNKLAGKGMHNMKGYPHGHRHILENGGALNPAGYGLYGAHKIPRKLKKKGKGAINNV